MRSLLRTLGNVWAALFLLVVLTAVLIVSTLLESAYGTPFVQRFFYQAGWFDVFLSLIFVNILCSTLTRWPYKKHHTGFVVTHLGILILLVGSLLTRLLGVEGQMGLTEGEADDRIRGQQYQLVIQQDRQEAKVFDIADSQKKARVLAGFDAPLGVTVLRTGQGLEEKVKIVPGREGDGPNRAVLFTLKGKNVGADTPLSLIERNPYNNHPTHIHMGPANFELRKKMPKPANESLETKIEGPMIQVAEKATGKVHRVDLAKALGKDYALGNSGLTISNLKYFLDARVGEKNELVSVSDRPANPAVEFDVVDAKGQKERHVKFALFPEFDSLHGKDAEGLFGLTVELVMPGAGSDTHSQGAVLIFFYDEKGAWSYESLHHGVVAQGTLEKGKTYSTGWMDFTFTVDDLLDHARAELQVELVEGAAKGIVGAELSVTDQGKEIARQWVLPGREMKLKTSSGSLSAQLGVELIPVPFRLALRDFRKVDYPGTTNAASYESDVTLEDASEGVMIKKTISMNKPLDYKGYRIFQSSFSQDPQVGEMSIFTVAKNPGIDLIYAGCVIMFIGVVLVFYVKPFSTLNIGGAHGVRKK